MTPVGAGVGGLDFTIGAAVLGDVVVMMIAVGTDVVVVVVATTGADEMGALEA